jgi:hypothetical protein
MKRRKLLLSIGTVAGASGVVGSSAFTSVEADRTAQVAVADDTDSFLELGPCEGSENGEYVRSPNGELILDLSPSNDGENGNLGEGVNSNAVSVFDDVFEIRNSGTQPVGVWLDLNATPKSTPDGLAIEFYLHDDQGTSVEGQSNARCLSVGESICVGFVIRTDGIGTGDSLFTDTQSGEELTINADADVACDVPGTPTTGDPTRTLYLSDSGPNPTTLYTVQLEDDAGQTPQRQALLEEEWPNGGGAVGSFFDQTDAIAATEDGAYVYFYDKNSGHLGVYDVGAGTFTDLGAVSGDPGDVVLAEFDPDGTLWVASQGDDTLYTVDGIDPSGIQTPSVTAEATLSIDVSGADFVFTFTPDATLFLWSSDSPDEGLHRIEAPYSSSTTTAVNPGASYDNALTGLALKSPSGEVLLGSDRENDEIIEIDSTTGTIGATYDMRLNGDRYTYDYGDMTAPVGTTVID